MSPGADVIVLSPFAQILRRGHGAIQFGLDASRAGIVELPGAPAIAACLAELEHPTRVEDALISLIDAGCEAEVARCLLDELLDFGVLRVARRPGAAVFGGSDLAGHLSGLLGSLGVDVRVPRPDEKLCALLADIPDQWPVVLADQFSWGARDAASVAFAANPVLSVAALDGRGLVGPVRLGGQGPCPMCVELHWVRQDRAFMQVVADIRPERQDPVTVAATSASAATVIQALLGVRSLIHPVAQAGDCLVIDPYSPDRGQRFTLSVNPGCPVCFERQSSGGVAA